MGMVGELIKLIPNIISNREKIFEAIVNSVKLEFGTMSEEEQAEIIRRRAICAGCPFMSNNAKIDGQYVTQRPDAHCIMCGCNINGKTACLTCNCGIEKFNEEHPDANLGLKWTAYGKTN